jgi:sugar/nucleoside kinase (ribokinase family)
LLPLADYRKSAVHLLLPCLPVTDRPPPILSLGEAIVDLICERHLAPGEAPHSFVPHHGGAPANVAAAVARQGAAASLLSGVGRDGWGEWLLDGLEAAAVGTDWVVMIDGANTPLATALFDASGEPSFQVYGEHVGPVMAAAARFLEQAVGECQALIVGSNTMVGETEREVTRRAVRLAGERGLPVLLDPNHRPTRWEEQQTAIDFGLELARSSTVVKCNRSEASLLTGVADHREATEALARLGPRLVVVTDGPGQVLTAGAVETSFAPRQLAGSQLVSPLGAGDAFMGALAAGLAGLDWDLRRVAEALPAACADAADCCRGWGARP